MKPIDYRNETWDQMRARVDKVREAVYLALDRHGPCTTRQLAQKSSIDILTVRPRVTELYQIGLVELANAESRGDEGVYRTVPWAVARSQFEKRQAAEKERQLTLL
jgi:predicted ArsR family transcriptional regulator